MAEAVIIQALVLLPLRKAGFLAADEFSLLWGFKKDLAKLKGSLEMVHGFLHDVQRRHEVKDGAIKVWLRNLEDVAYDADNVLDEFNYEVLRQKVEIRNQMTRKVRFFFSLSNPILFRFKMAHQVQEINNRLRAINEEARAFGLQTRMALADIPQVLAAEAATINRETGSIHNASNFIGRDKETSKIAELLKTPSDEAISVIPIQGMGGIGKTRLAQNIFNDPQIGGRFEKQIWTCVSDNNFNVTKLFDLILESLNKKRPEADTREARQQMIREELEGKICLLVLDDVWDDNYRVWGDFLESLEAMNTAQGSFILVTTRKQEVASMVGRSPLVVNVLSDDDCWLILTKTAFGAGEIPQELQDRRDDIAKKCRGLPLLASVLGGMLRNKGTDEWVSVLENRKKLHDLTGDDYALAILKVSFDHLPSPACKNCFAYCSIFPKDYEISREEIVSLWMAEGFLETNTESNLEMEEIGNEIFNILLRSSLLMEDSRKLLLLRQQGVFESVVRDYKMHDLVHDLAQSVLRSNTVSEEQTRGRDFDRVHYPAIGRSKEGIEHLLSKEVRHVLTLFSENKISNSSISRFRRLRTLNLSGSNVEELPVSIGKLRQIRYLDISGTRIKALPRSLCKLYRLQTLRARDGWKVNKFPDDFKNLISLRHFDYYTYDTSSTSMPIEMGHLSHLRTLPFFNVGVEKGRQIEELKGLKNLCGSLQIRNLVLVNGKCGAESANLIGKPNISELAFVWNWNRAVDNNHNDVLEGLQPHRNLKHLVVKNFMGDQFASWIGKLDSLTVIKLILCMELKELPPLGQLPFLQDLMVSRADNITAIGPSFYRFDNCGGEVTKNPFPKLKTLKLEFMTNLTEWMEAKVTSTLGHQVAAFPLLERLEIHGCRQLTCVPSHFPNLQVLSISTLHNDSTVITKICSGTTNIRTLSLAFVEKFTCLPDGLLQRNPNLEELYLGHCPDLGSIVPEIRSLGDSLKRLQIKDCHMFIQLPNDLHSLHSLCSFCIISCPNLQSIPIPRGQERLTSLRNLEISNCDGLIHLPIEMLEPSILSSMEYLSVSNCRNLESLPIDFHQIQMPSLRKFELFGCPKLSSMPSSSGILSLAKLSELSIGPSDNTDFEYFSDHVLDGLHHPPSSLGSLRLHGRANWDSLPDQLQNLSALRRLSLYDFGIEALPDWLGNLSSLTSIGLHNCGKLQYLPAIKVIHKMKFANVSVDNCPLFEEGHINQQSGPDSKRSKVSHIGIHINGNWCDY